MCICKLFSRIWRWSASNARGAKSQNYINIFYEPIVELDVDNDIL